MTQSMTAFASRMGALGSVSWQWEMRGVNGRGLDVRLRLPDGLGGLEADLRSQINAVIARGSVTVNLRLTRGDSAGVLAIDEARLDSVLAALDIIQERAFTKGVTLGQPTAADVLSQRGVLIAGEVEDDSAALFAALSADIAPLLADFNMMRQSEGMHLHAVIADQLTQIADLTDRAGSAAADRMPKQRETLTAALQRVISDVAEADPGRIAQELALLAVKSDVTEEIDRLGVHVKAAWGLLNSDTPTGRKFDFLAQEFNREANTLCAKAQSAPLTAIGLDLKAMIDQMREQIQNVE